MRLCIKGLWKACMCMHIYIHMHKYAYIYIIVQYVRMQPQIIGHLTNNIWYDSVSNSSMVRSGSLALIPEKKSSSSAVPNACGSDRDPYLVAWPNGCWL